MAAGGAGDAPFAWASALLGPTLLTKKGEEEGGGVVARPTGEALAGVKYVALYFSASWCGPCQKLTPVLSVCYEDQPTKEVEVRMGWLGGWGVPVVAFDHIHAWQTWQLWTNPLPPTLMQVVFVSDDSDIDSFNEYFGEMPWYVAWCVVVLWHATQHDDPSAPPPPPPPPGRRCRLRRISGRRWARSLVWQASRASLC